MYTPEDFRSTYPPERIGGTEMEYGLPCEQLSPVAVVHRVAKLIDPKMPLLSNNQGAVFLANGAKALKELELLYEYSTQESLGPRDMLVSDMAGQEVSRAAVFMLQNEMEDVDSSLAKNGLYRRVGFYVLNQPEKMQLKNRPDFQTTGYHENYYTPRWTNESLGKWFMASFLATKHTWAGSGMYYRGEFLTSQKALSVGAISDAKAHDNKQRGMLRLDTSSLVAEGFQRIENRSGEPVLHSPYIQWLGFAATSLALRLMEYHPAGTHSLTLRNPIQALQETAHLNRGALVELTDHTKMTPLEHQAKIFEMVDHVMNAYQIELPYEEQVALQRLRDLAENPTADNLGWYARWEYLQQKLGDSDPQSWPIEHAIYHDMQFDNLLKPRNKLSGLLLNAYAIPGSTPDDSDGITREEILDRVRNAPQTRAAIRAATRLSNRQWSVRGIRDPYRTAA
jgi:hypothetical protein